jgi:hypothetical protein
MDVDQILQTMNGEAVDYLLIGGVNFLLRHHPELTFDVDIWVRDEEDNLRKLNSALRNLGAEWGPTEKSWAPVSEQHAWLRTQGCFCLTTPHGALDIFREVKGSEGKYHECKRRAISEITASGIPYFGLSDEDMLRCQEALSLGEQKPKRMEILRKAIALKGKT